MLLDIIVVERLLLICLVSLKKVEIYVKRGNTVLKKVVHRLLAILENIALMKEQFSQLDLVSQAIIVQGEHKLVFQGEKEVIFVQLDVFVQVDLALL